MSINDIIRAIFEGICIKIQLPMKRKIKREVWKRLFKYKAALYRVSIRLKDSI